jgi:hypothetical protein
MTIKDSQFLNNTMTSTSDTVYGTVTVDTGVPSTSSAHTLTLTASGGQSTVFDGNRIIDQSASDLKNADGSRTNSIYFGSIPDVSGIPDAAAADARLVIAPQTNGIVALYDPIWVKQDNGFSFNMDVEGSGHFIWGGRTSSHWMAPRTVPSRSKTGRRPPFSMAAVPRQWSTEYPSVRPRKTPCPSTPRISLSIWKTAPASTSRGTILSICPAIPVASVILRWPI